MGPLSVSPDRQTGGSPPNEVRSGIQGKYKQRKRERKKPELESHMGLHFLNAFCISFDSIRKLEREFIISSSLSSVRFGSVRFIIEIKQFGVI